MTTLGLLALWRWSEGEGRRWIIIGAALLACGILAHYDAALALPAAAYVVGRRLWRARWQAFATEILGAGTLAIGILALFYIPFVLHPNFAKTMGYLGGSRIGTGGPLYNNLLASLPLATFYNSTYYLIGLACLLIIASLFPFRRLGLLIPAVCYFLILQSTIRNPQSAIWTGPALAGLLIVILFSRSSSASSRAAWLWFGAPFLFYYFLVWDPRTHVLNAFAGAVLLAAFALDRLPSFAPCRRTPNIIHWSLLIAFLFLAYYPYLMFVQHDPEIKRTWPVHQPTLYWKPGDETPLFGYFGFPYQAGWKVIGILIEEGTLDGVYASNEEQEITDWYTQGAERTYCSGAEWYFMAKNVQDEVSIRQTNIEETCHLWGEIQIAGEPTLWIYHKSLSAAPPTIFHAEDYTTRFDARMTLSNIMPPPPADHTPAGYTLGKAARLLGYDLDTTDAHPGGFIYLVLHWEALQPIETNYQVFNHLYDGTMWGQQDGTPGCALQPTTLWEPGQIVRDEYIIPIDPSAPAGDIPLLVGMYRLGTGERLPVYNPDGVSIGDAIPLAVVTIQ